MNTFKLEEYLAKHEFTAKYLLCCSDAESFSMNDVLNLASDKEMNLWNNLKLGYTETQGIPELKKVISKEMYPELAPSNIMTFAGAEEGIFCTLNTLLSEGDHVIAFTPCYQSLIEIPKSKKVELTEIELKEENSWRINLGEVKKVIKKNTKCIVMNFPHNPTGQVINQDELKALIDICSTNDIWLFSDEVYRLLGNPDEEWANPAACAYEKGISLGVMSKAFGMPGLRVGWIACRNKELLERIEKLKHYTSICNSAPSEILSLIALKAKDAVLKRNNDIVKANITILDQFFSKYENIFNWVRPQGGCVGFVKYKGIGTVDNFCEQLVEDKSVLLLPASVYDCDSNHFRIGFGRKNMPEALNELEDFINKKLLN